MKYAVFSPQKGQIKNVSFWQSPIWKMILLKSHQVHDAFYFGDIQSTFFLVEVRSVGAGFYGAFILGWKKSQGDTHWEECFEALKKELKKRKIIFLQIEPLDEIDFSKPSKEKLLKIFIMPFTRVVSLEGTGEDFLQNMLPKGRYYVRSAQKKGVEIELHQEFSEDILDAWMGLINETTTRDNFSHNSRKYYETFFKELRENGLIGIAKKDDKIIAMAVIVLCGDEAIYYYGASTSILEYRKLASHHLLLWKTMIFASEQGKTRYDLLGVADPDNPNDPLQNVSQFKSKFGGNIEKLPPKYLFPLSSGFYLYKALVSTKRLFKK